MTIDIDAIRKQWLAQCGPCDAGLPTRCTHPDADYRPTIAALCDAIEQLRESAGYYSALVGERNAELTGLRADLAAAHNHAHRQDTNLQQIARAKDEIAAERDALKGENYRLRAKLADLGKPADADHWANLDGTCWSDCPACETERAGATR